MKVGNPKGQSLKTVAFDRSKVLNLTKDGLDYLDDEGRRCSVRFHICRENFKKEMHLAERLWARDPNYVAVRDVDATPPHVTFATNPPTRFVFSAPHPDFHEFQLRLFNEAGVKTFDMT